MGEIIFDKLSYGVRLHTPAPDMVDSGRERLYTEGSLMGVVWFSQGLCRLRRLPQRLRYFLYCALKELDV